MEDSRFDSIMPYRYPVGIQSFEEIRTRGMVYVDKTNLLFQLLNGGSYYFLSRPRRFGKSLMLSTLKAYFEGKRHLFDGLALSKLTSDWEPRPVIYLSLATGSFTDVETTKSQLHNLLDVSQTQLNMEVEAPEPQSRFLKLIKFARIKYGKKIAVLIDEYDKPLLDTQFKTGSENEHDAIRELLRAFYSCVKDCGEDISFAMITGVTKFSHLNVFSGLNNLNDISLDADYNALCGISQSEMDAYFERDMEVFGLKNNLTVSQVGEKFKEYYDGYHFAGIGEDIYNPFSVLSAFSKMKFGNYWYKSANPQYLIKALVQEPHFKYDELEGFKASEEMLMDPNVSYSHPVALLYQSGYLTIKGYNEESDVYTLGFPNREVSSGFSDNLMSAILPPGSYANGFSSALLVDYAVNGDADGLMSVLDAGLASFKYDQLKEPTRELHFHLMLHIMCLCAGIRVESEVQTVNGRIDMVLKTKKFIYIIEFKVNETVDEACRQILTKDYSSKYSNEHRKLILVGANFSTETRLLTGWKIIS